MNSRIIKTSEVKEFTLFLLKHRIILHPILSPNGIPRFSDYGNKAIKLIIDRNILIYLLNMVKNGTLNDSYQLKLVSSLMAWTKLNGITIIPGIALMEYSYFNKGTNKANDENNKFLKIINDYTIRDWIDVAVDNTKKIPKINSNNSITNNFFVESDHFKMHYLEMLVLSQLYLNKELSIVEKFEYYFKWTYDNIIMGSFSTSFAILIFNNKSKMLKKNITNFVEIDKKCVNQAWDLTYLSIWSTFYKDETNSDEIFLFATNDKELKQIFFVAIENNLSKVINNSFSKRIATQILMDYKKIYIPRKHPIIKSKKLDDLIEIEKRKLIKIINNAN